MKTILYILLLVVTQQLSFGQKKITKDLDGDGINDTVLIDTENGSISYKLSSQNFKKIISEGEVGDLSLTETESGFELSINYMRAGYKTQFRYNKNTKKMQLIGLSRYQFGNAAGEGSGESSVNLLTNNYIGNWNYGWNNEKDKIVAMPTIKTKMVLPKASFESFEKAYSSFESQCSELYYEQKENFFDITTEPKAYNKYIKRDVNDINYTKMAFKDVPKSIKYEGQIINALNWTDKKGEHIIITSETGIYQSSKFSHDDNNGADAELFAYYFIKKENTYKQQWKVYDYIADCPVDIEANFIKNTLHITDLDNNGLVEIWLMYTKICHGDVSPSQMKIIMYQDNQKYGMRGENRIQLAKNEYIGGEYKFDKKFTEAPKSFRKFAKKMWNENIEQTWAE